MKANSSGMPFLYVVGDSWFFSKKTAGLAGSLGKVWIFESKKDRVVLIPHGWVHPSKWAMPREKSKVAEAHYKTTKHTYWCYAKDVIMKKVGRVNILISYQSEGLSGEPKFL